MWLGTEDGTIHVYNCTDNIRIKKNKDKFCHTAPILAILYVCHCYLLTEPTAIIDFQVPE